MKRSFCLLLCMLLYMITYAKNYVTVFNSGENNINSYRIPSVITAKDGTIIVFCEARIDSWKDKSRTDIVMKKSSDNGKTWSQMINLTKGKTGAYMDPTPILDNKTGRIFLFTAFWPENNHTGKNNNAYMITSDDNGNSWSEIKDVTKMFSLKDNEVIIGFGPGTGIEMKGDKFRGRLILPIRVLNKTNCKGYNMAGYSDDNGKTWLTGKKMDIDNEFQIAEFPNDILISNSRVNEGRMVSRSYDGGITWDESIKDKYLPGVISGCQGSILSFGNDLYYSGIKGIKPTEDFDGRANLYIFKSCDSGTNWNEYINVYKKGAGYSCMTITKNGTLGIVYEATSTNGFTRKSIPGSKPLKRPSGWMRIDFTILNIEK